MKAEFADGEDYFFYLGAVHPRKNVHRLISAFYLFKQQTQSRLKLLIGGRLAWQTGVVQRAYEQAKYKADIILLGLCRGNDIAPFIGRCTCTNLFISI